MDLFVESVGVGAPGFPDFGHGKGLVMGYYDGNTTTAIWNYAQHFAMLNAVFRGFHSIKDWRASWNCGKFRPWLTKWRRGGHRKIGLPGRYGWGDGHSHVVAPQRSRTRNCEEPATAAKDRQAVIEIADDGRGLNAASIRAKAIQKGLI